MGTVSITPADTTCIAPSTENMMIVRPKVTEIVMPKIEKTLIKTVFCYKKTMPNTIIPKSRTILYAKT